MTGRLIEQLETAIAEHEGYVDFVSGSPEWPRLEIAPLDVGPTMQDGGVGQPRRDPHERDDPVVARRSGRPAGRRNRRRRRRQPVRLSRPTRSCTARTPPRSAVREVPPGGARGAGRPHQGRRRAHTRPVHELAGDGRGRRRRSSGRAVHDPHPARPAQAGVGPRHSRPTTRRACSRRPDCSRASTSPGRRSPSSSSTGSRSPGPTIRCCRRAASCSAGQRSARSTYHGRRCSWRRHAAV